MRKLLTLTTAAVLLFACGGGGGGGSSSTGGGGGTTTTSGLTINSASGKGVSVSTVLDALAKSGLSPQLVCDEGVLTPDDIGEGTIHFAGESFTNCTLVFAADNGNVVNSGLGTITAGSGAKVTFNNDCALSAVSNATVTSLADTNGNCLADALEGKKVSGSGFEDASLYDKLVVVVLEGDDLGSSSLTSYLQANYNDLVSGLSAVNPNGVKFAVIWDGDLGNGTDGNSDVFILDPSSGKNFSVLYPEMQNIISGADSVADYSDDGIKFWYAPSDNLSNHLKHLIQVALAMYPANSVDLIISDHGDGWVSLPTPTERTVLFENSATTGMTWLGTKQFVDTVLKPLKDSGVNIDLLGFDECLMGELATLSLMKDYANVIVASPEYELAEGWATVYSQLAALYSTYSDSWNIAKGIVDGYKNYYANNEPSCAYCYSQDIALTAVKTSALSQLVSAFEQFAGSLYQTAQNEVTNGQMYDVFRSFFDNGMENEKAVYWGTSNLFDENDDTAYRLYNATDWALQQGKTYHKYYGGNFQNYLGWDSMYLVSRTGLSKRDFELGASPDQVLSDYFIYDPSNPTFITPDFDADTVQNALNFLDTYNATVNNDGLYTVYLHIDYNPDTNPLTDSPVTGSGLSLIYPYTSLEYAVSPKLNLCNYQNFIESYNETLPNYTGFVKTVFEEMWKAVEDSGLADEFSCDSGNVVWK